MNKPIIAAISKVFLGLALATTVIAAQANPTDKPDNSAKVKYLGMAQNSLYFNVAYNNPTGSKFAVIILDREGNELFRDSYSDRNFDRRFILPGVDASQLTFVVRDFKNPDMKETFKINTQFSENVVVTQVQ
jgi:hypothetical protein